MLSADALSEALESGVDWNLRQRIDRLAPTRIAVPSGMQRDIGYALDDHGEPASPVLAVKLQELFGLAQTPRIAEGRVPLTLHLLSPAGRPLQVTQDLRGFWERTYPEVKKEMKGGIRNTRGRTIRGTRVATHRAKPRGLELIAAATDVSVAGLWRPASRRDSGPAHSMLRAKPRGT